MKDEPNNDRRPELHGQSADGDQTCTTHDTAERSSPSRRRFLRRTTLGLTTLSAGASVSAKTPDSWLKAGSGFSNYGQADTEGNGIIRWISANPSVPGEGVSWTPLHQLEGTITPNGLHFERHHNGVPDIDVDTWTLSVHGQVKRALSFTLDTLRRYPMESRIGFIECGGNSNSLWHERPVQAAAGHLHGLVSCAEWTGVRLSTLLKETDMEADAQWLIADGLDASGVTASLPLDKCLDDVLLVLYQNGEPLRRENGFPARLFVPGWEGIVNIKWLRSLQISTTPLWSKFDTVSYTDLLKNGLADRMTFTMGVKSVVTSPSLGTRLKTGFYEIRGLAWSGAGYIDKVEVSADAGNSWHSAELQAPVLDKSLTRFTIAWQWDGKPCVLMSRAVDSAGRVQPTRQALVEEKGVNVYHHYNAILAWQVHANGTLSHVYS
ncbi:MAG: sulfite dehydrogenase [Granulosicoccus sp.]